MDKFNFCKDCKYIEPTEEEQNYIFRKTRQKPDHFCKKYNKRIMHKEHHPDLLKLNECTIEN